MHSKSLGKSHGLMETVHAFISTWVSRRLCLALACRQAHTEDLKSSGGDRKKGSVSTEKERVNVNAWGRCIVRVTDVHQRFGIDLHAIHPETEMSMLIVILESVFPSGLPGGGGADGNANYAARDFFKRDWRFVSIPVKDIVARSWKFNYESQKL